MVSYWFYLVNTQPYHKLTKRSSSSALFKTSHPSLLALVSSIHALYTPLHHKKDLTVFHRVSLGWSTGDKRSSIDLCLVTESIQVLFVPPPPTPSSSYLGAPPLPPNRTGCLPVYIYIPGTLNPTDVWLSLITESINVCSWVLIYFYWCIDISMYIHYATVGCTPQIRTNEHDLFSSTIYTPTKRIKMFITGGCGGPFC